MYCLWQFRKRGPNQRPEKNFFFQDFALSFIQDDISPLKDSLRFLCFSSLTVLGLFLTVVLRSKCLHGSSQKVDKGTRNIGARNKNSLSF